ncbi:MAG: cell division protein FtsA [Syntrophomonadaceae bacterium]|nr:cell division protein FtsA [Syntrophomonadaceae bacterium]
MARRNVVVGLDIGTTKTVVLVGEVAPNGRVYIIGVGEAPSRGLRKGAIVDIEDTVRSIDQAVEKAEHMSGVEVDRVMVAVSGSHLNSLNNRGVVAVAGPGREITSVDVERVLYNTRMIVVPPERRIVHVLPRQYIVDGYDSIRDPVGMIGVRLEVEAHIITASSTYLQNLVKCVEKAGLRVETLVVNPMAAAEASVLPEEKELGVLLVDIGGGTTDMALFEKGSLWLTSGLPLGGDHITSDLAVGLRTTLLEAERVKREYGCVLMELISGNESVMITNVGSREVNQITRRNIVEVIQPRVQEILMLVREAILRSGYQGALPGGCVLTGGTALLAGMKELAQDELQLPVRIGYPEGLGGLVDVAHSPQFSTVAGLVLQAAKQFQVVIVAEADPLLGGIWGKLKSWWKELA